MTKQNSIFGEAEDIFKELFERVRDAPYRVDCPESEQLVDYQEGLLSLSRQLRLYLHLRACSDCQREVAFLSELDRHPFSPALTPIPSPPPFSNTLREKKEGLAEFLAYLQERGKQLINALPPPQTTVALRGTPGASSPPLRRKSYHADGYEITLTLTPPTSDQDLWRLEGDIYDTTSFSDLSGNIYLLAGDELARHHVLDEEDEGEFVLEGVASGNYTILFDVPDANIQIDEFRLTWTPQELADLLLSPHDPSNLSRLAESLRSYLTLEVIEELKRRVDGEMYRNAQQALKMAEVAETVAGFISIPEAQALAWWAKGNAYHFLVRNREALSCYQRAESIYAAQGRQIKVVRLQSNQLAVLQGMGEYQETLTLYQKARLICEAIGSQAQKYLASMEMNIGVTYRRMGELAAGLAAYQRAYTLFATLPGGGQETWLARIDINRANVLKDMDRFSEAEPLYLRARDVLAGAGLHQEVARTELNLGVLAYRRGRYQAALRYLEAARSRFAAIPNPVEVAVVDLDRSFVYRHLNMLEETITLATSAEQTFEKKTMPWAQAYALSNQGIGHQRLGAYAQAGERFIKARRIFQEQGAPSRALQLDLELAHLALEAGERKKAQQLASQVLEALDAETWPSLVARGHLLLAQVALAESPPELAIAHQHTEQAQAMAQAHHLHEITIRGHHLMGQLLERRGDLEGAWQAYQRAIQTVEWLRQLLALDEFRMGFMEDKLPIYASAVHLSQKMATQPTNGESPSLAQLFYTLNLATAAPLRRLPNSFLRQPGEGKLTQEDHKLRERLEQLREQWYWHQSKLEGEADAKEKPIVMTRTGSYEEKLHELEMEMAELMRRWQVRTTPLLRPSEAISRFSTTAEQFLASIQAHLRPQDILLHYYLVDGHVQALLITPSESHLVKDLVTVEHIKKTYDKWHSDLGEAPSPQSHVRRAKRHLYKFHKALVAPLAKHLTSCQQIFLVMPPEWHTLPVSAFFDRKDYLAQHYQLTYLSAPEVLLRESSKPLVTPSVSESPPAGAVVLGYSNKKQVPHTLDEARHVAQMLAPHLPTTLLLEEEATFAHLHHASQKSRLLHLASHAIFNSNNPLFSWVRLADNHLKVIDLYDQINLPHHPLVVLSACDTGRGKPRGGGLLGMARGFMAAGANGLIVSLWKAPDESSAQLMADFYPHLLQPTTPPAALQHAQQQAIARDYHPYHWAGFIFIQG